VTSIGDYAFDGLTSVTIPNSVISIGDYAFLACPLTSVTVDIETPLSISSSTFSNRANATLYVPYGRKSTYEAADYWKEFKEIVEMPNYDQIKIGSTGMATYCSMKAMDFTGVKGLKAYIATGYDYDSGNILLTRIYKVPAGTGIMLMGTAGTYEIPHVETNYTYASMLKGVTTSTHLDQASDGYTNYILMNGADGVLFYKVSASGGSLAANRAYLQIPIRDAEANTLNFVFDDEGTTGIQRLKNGMTEELKSVYDLNGRRVENPKKGVHIVNGKKVILK